MLKLQTVQFNRFTPALQYKRFTIKNTNGLNIITR